MIAHAVVWPEQARPYVAQVSSTAVTGAETLSKYVKLGSISAERSPEDQKIDTLEHLSANWDMRRSPPPTADSITAAREWLSSLRQAAESSGLPWRAPHISASDSGEITFEWWRGHRKVTLYFGDRAPEFVKVWGPHIFDEMDSGDLLSSESFGALWLWLNAA